VIFSQLAPEIALVLEKIISVRIFVPIQLTVVLRRQRQQPRHGLVVINNNVLKRSKRPINNGS
jgi:hypothetical protein